MRREHEDTKVWSDTPDVSYQDAFTWNRVHLDLDAAWAAKDAVAWEAALTVPLCEWTELPDGRWIYVTERPARPEGETK